MWIFPLGAAAVGGVFAAQLTAHWVARRGPHQAAWAVALAMFAGASLAAAIGMLLGWSPAWFRTYYLLGAIVNVPVLALGTIYLLGPRSAGHAAAVLVVSACVFAAVRVLSVELMVEGLATDGIPPGREVMPPAVRTLSRYYSIGGSAVVVAGAVWSAVRLARSREPSLRSLAVGNWLIAAGTFVVAGASGFVRVGRGSVFAVGLLAGIALMYLGFLATRAATKSAAG